MAEAVAPAPASDRSPGPSDRLSHSVRVPSIARAVKFTFPSFTATRNATSGCRRLRSFVDLLLHQLGELVKRHRLLADLAAGLDQRSYRSWSLSISRTGSWNAATCRMRSSAALSVRRRGRRRLRERPGPPFFARAQAAVPEIDERREARLQRREAEAIAGVLDVRAVELLDERLDAARAFPMAASAAVRRRTCCIRLRAASARPRAAAGRVRCRTAGRPRRCYRGMRNQTSGSHSSRAYGTGRSSMSTSVVVGRGRRSRTDRAAGRRRSTRTARDSGASSPAPVSRILGRRRAPCSSARAKSGASSGGKHQRDRERPRPRAEQRLVQIGIERRQLLVGRLLGQIGVRPEALERPVLR